MPEWRRQDIELMGRAMALARRGLGRVEPNPMVGCVVVRGGRVLGEGYHRKFGGKHAEIEALARCKGSARGATVYVTLEPCCHHGKTPPCSDSLIAAGVRRVVAAMRDPFAAVAGRGFARLRRAGIEVGVGLCGEQARRLNAAYLKLRTEGRPWVILKWAQSLDGKIATRTGDSKWISSQAARREAHRLRGRVDAVIVGSGTARVDDPMLTCRHVRARRMASRIVVTGGLRIDPRSKLVRTAGQVPTIVATTRASLRRHARLVDVLREAGCEVLGVGSRRGRVSLAGLLDELGGRQMTNVLVEGGGDLLGVFFDDRLADEVVMFVSPKLIGGAAAPGPLGGVGVSRVLHGVGQEDLVERRHVGGDMMYRILLRDPAQMNWRRGPKQATTS
ncbi:MAG TPA: bifunctional diaminohydroxyphosphoribosylaminopyrimidine deaminase/5-amino-6-(5-phosphoribosylamino)uracil reductase RibD [Phycisphaerae bacterium]|nr:bifunctional diaminohydroxyphosphoribosylaminopyrimidine deaminase/5-amino-6-(5-phosphoribosylamino)uracil reductase RibD [Phycisphaerae bacterium]